MNQARYRLKMHIENAFATVNERPVIVIGNQKSGTSALVSLLAAAAGKSATNDIFTWYGGLETDVISGRLEFDTFVQKARHHFSRDFIKDPSFTFMLPALSARFPDARYVFVVRDPRYNIRGILNRVGVPGTIDDLSAEQIARVRRERPGWLPVLSGQGLVQDGSLITRLAHRCRIAMELADAWRQQWPIIRYEDFLDDKVGTIAATLEAIGEHATRNIADIVDVPFQPPSKDRSSPLDFFGPDNLARIEVTCNACMKQFSYL